MPTDDHIGNDFSQHHFGGMRRHREQVFERAALVLAGHRDGGHHHHGHGQDDSDESRHDVVLGQALGIVAALDDGGERRDGRPAGQRSDEIMAKRAGRQLRHRCERIRGSRRIACIGLDQELGVLSADEIAGEIDRHRNHERDFALVQHTLRVPGRARDRDEVEIVGILERRFDGARVDAVVGDVKSGGQMFRIGIDGEAEKQELKHRNADHHRESGSVAAHLDELLDQDGDQPREGKAQFHCAFPLAP
jgi:hypothetical protein